MSLMSAFLKASMLAYVVLRFYATNLKKWGAYWLCLVRVFIRTSVRSKKARVLKFHIWIPQPVFFLVRVISPCGVMSLLRPECDFVSKIFGNC